MTYDKDNIVFVSKPTHSTLMDIEGQRFERLTVIGYAGTDKRKTAVWYCECTCGNVTKVVSCDLRRTDAKRVRSCGCLQREQASIHGQLNYTHQQSKTRIYRIWGGMRNRCSNPNDKAWKRYGGRGITVCPQWGKFECFLQDMGHPPTSKHTLDRIDVNGHYEPSNCRWATPEEQANNKRNTRYITFQNKTQSLTLWSRETGIHISTLDTRLYRLHWSVEKTFTTPIWQR